MKGRLAVVGVLLVAGVAAALWLMGRLPWKPPASVAMAGGDAGVTDGSPADAPAGDAPAADASARVRRQLGPLSSAQLGSPVVSSHWFASCDVPETTKVVVKLDIRQGRAVKVDVKTDPTDPVAMGCIERAASDLRWDVSKKTDHITVRY